MHCLFLHRRRFDQLYPFFFTFDYLVVHSFRITSKPRIRIHKPVIITKLSVAKFFIARLFCLVDGAVEDTDFVSINYFYFNVRIQQIIFVIKFPVVIFKVSKTFTEASAFIIFFLFGLRTSTAFLTIIYLLKWGFWEVIKFR